MKCLSVKQPYASAIIKGLKDIDNRTWTTDYRGKLSIHAAKEGVNLFDIKDYRMFPLITDLNYNYNAEKNIFKHPSPYYQPIGDDLCAIRLFTVDEEREEDFFLAHPDGFWFSAILGEVDLVDIVRDSESRWAERGMYHWVLQNPKEYKLPITQVRGKLRLWDFNP